MSKGSELRWALFFAHPSGRNKTEPDFPDYEYWHPNKQSAIVEGKRVLKELRSQGDKRDWYAGVHFDPFKINEVREPNAVTRIPIHDLP